MMLNCSLQRDLSSHELLVCCGSSVQFSNGLHYPYVIFPIVKGTLLLLGTAVWIYCLLTIFYTEREGLQAIQLRPRRTLPLALGHYSRQLSFRPQRASHPTPIP